MEKVRVKKELYRESDFDYIEINVDELPSEALEKGKGNTIQISIEDEQILENGQICQYILFEIIQDRMETDEEFQQRMLKEQEDEYQLYKRLQKKFKNYPQ